MKKRIIALMIASFTAFSLMACGATSGTTEDDVTEESTVTEVAETDTQTETDSEMPTTLDEWLETEYANRTKTNADAQVAASKMTVSFGAEGSVFIYNYHIAGDSEYNTRTQEDWARVINENQTTVRGQVDSIISTFKNSYDIDVTAVRMCYYNSNGDQVYTVQYSSSGQ